MPPKAKSVSKKDAEKAEAERLKKEQEELEELRRQQFELAQKQAQEEARLEAERWNCFPKKFRLRVAQVGWSVNNPPERCQHHAYSCNGKLLVVGGCEAERNAILYTLDQDGKRWTKQPLAGVPPITYAGQSSVLYQDNIFVYGGYTAKTGFQPSLHRLDLQALAWTPQPYQGDAPRFYAMSAVCYESVMLCLGGRSVEQVINPHLYQLNLKSFVWTTIHTSGIPPTPRFWHSAIVYKNCMWVYGGLDVLGSVTPTVSRDQGLGNMVHVLNLATMQWSPVVGQGHGPGRNNRIYGHACSQFKNGMLITGGSENDSVFMFNCDRLRWEIPPCVGDGMAVPRMFHSTCVFPEQEIVVLFGGKLRKSDKLYNDVYFLEMLREAEAS